jgi:succinyl-diaminopimelate desuccinylase
MNTTILTQQLIQKQSVTPLDKGCQELMITRLQRIGFEITKLNFGKGDEMVENFFAIKYGSDANSKSFMFAGHTDVVPVGDANAWQHPPFTATIVDDMLYGRGAADMKGSLAAMVVACEEFIANTPHHTGNIAFLITSDEEGPAINGTVKVCKYLQEQNINIDYCLVGEPSSTNQLGDVIKNGRRGSLNGFLTIFGKQGHIAYPHLANNPIHLATAFLDELTTIAWDEGDEYFSPTSLQISNINSGTGATNVIPAAIEIVFNFRYNTTRNHLQLQEIVEDLLQKYKLNYALDWQHSGASFITKIGDLVNASIQSCKEVVGVESKISTTGGTSDGRFIAPMLECELIELGPLNATIHQVDERVNIQDLENLSKIYTKILEKLVQ